MYKRKYELTFDSERGNEYKIIISKDEYQGEIIHKKLGAAPVLRMEDGEYIRATSLEFAMQADAEGELREFYTTNGKEFEVQLTQNGHLIWMGHVLPELYSEPYIAPPYCITITASDGLGRLKDFDYDFPSNGDGKDSIYQIILNCLSHTGMLLTIIHPNTMHSTLAAENTQFAMIQQAGVHGEMYNGEKIYDVLERVMKGIGCYITQRHGYWYIVRYTDMDAAGYVLDPRMGGITGKEPVTLKTMGSMDDDTYPIGYLNMGISPAKRDIEMDLKYKLADSYLTNWNFDEGLNGWDWSNGASASKFEDTGYALLKYSPEDDSEVSWIAKGRPNRKRTYESIHIEFEFALQSIYQEGEKEFDVWIRIYAGNTTKWHSGIRWEDTQQIIKVKGQLQKGKTYGSYRRPNPTRRFTVPTSWEKFSLDLSGLPMDGTLRINIENPNRGTIHSGGSRPSYVTGDAVNLYIRNVKIMNAVEQPGRVNIVMNSEASKDAGTFETEFIDAPFEPNADVCFLNTPIIGDVHPTAWNCDGIADKSLANLTLQTNASIDGVKKATLNGTIRATKFDLLRDKFSDKLFYATSYEWDLLEDNMSVELCEFVKTIDIPEITELNI